MTGQCEARPQTVQRFHNIQALAGGFGQDLARRQGQIAISPLFAAPDAPAQLIQLSQSKHIGPVNDHRVGIGNVQAAFHDIGGQQDIIFPANEVCHDLFQFARGHAAMSHSDIGIR